MRRHQPSGRLLLRGTVDSLDFLSHNEMTVQIVWVCSLIHAHQLTNLNSSRVEVYSTPARQTLVNDGAGRDCGVFHIGQDS